MNIHIISNPGCACVLAPAGCGSNKQKHILWHCNPASDQDRVCHDSEQSETIMVTENYAKLLPPRPKLPIHLHTMHTGTTRRAPLRRFANSSKGTVTEQCTHSLEQWPNSTEQPPYSVKQRMLQYSLHCSWSGTCSHIPYTVQNWIVIYLLYKICLLKNNA